TAATLQPQAVEAVARSGPPTAERSVRLALAVSAQDGRVSEASRSHLRSHLSDRLATQQVVRAFVSHDEVCQESPFERARFQRRRCVGDLRNGSEPCTWTRELRAERLLLCER